MDIICLVKFVPKVDDFRYDYERNVLIREGVKVVINPDDACALELALQMKDRNPDVQVEVVCMGPLGFQEKLEDLIRRGADCATLISDKLYVGSDSFVTAQILSAYLKKREFDLILSGSQTLDGDTGHIGPQIGELLDITQCSNVVRVDELSVDEAIIKVDDDDRILTLSLSMPALLSISRDSKYKLRFAKSADIDKDVSHQLMVVNNNDFDLEASDVGLKGSPTKVKKTFVPKRETREAEFVNCDNEGIEKVYNFLKEKGVG